MGEVPLYTLSRGNMYQLRPGIRSMPRLAEANSPLPARKLETEKRWFGPTLSAGGVYRGTSLIRNSPHP